MKDRIKLLVNTFGEDRVRTNIQISEYLETRQNIKVEAFYIATSSKELVRFIGICKELALETLIVGSGSRVILPEHEFDGVVIKNRSDRMQIAGIKGHVSRSGLGVEEAFIEADSGVSLKRLAEFAKKQSLMGCEFLFDYLGTIGGALKTSGLLKTYLHQVKILSKSGETKIKEGRSKIVEDDVILSVTLKLKAKR